MNDHFIDKRKQIENLQKLRLENCSSEILAQNLNGILTGLIQPVIELKNDIIYRARKNDTPTLFEHYADLISPKRSTREGRFNKIGESIFYGALDELGTILELQPDVGSIFTISKFICNTNERPLFHPLGLKKEPYQIPNLTKEQRLITEFINSEITKINDYTLSILIGRHFLTHCLPIKDIEGDFLYACLLYPSVKTTIMSNKPTCNIATTPLFFDKYYAFEESSCYILTNEGSYFQLNKLNKTIGNDNGNIRWKYSFEEMYLRWTKKLLYGDELYRGIWD